MKSAKHQAIVISLVLTILVWLYYPTLLIKVVDLIYQLYFKFFVLRFTFVEIVAIGFIPFWVYLAYKWKPIKIRGALILLTLLASLIVVNILGGIIAIYADADGPSPLLPDYVVYEVFPFYWTVVNLIGVAVGILPFKPWINPKVDIREAHLNKKGIIDT